MLPVVRIGLTRKLNPGPLARRSFVSFSPLLKTWPRLAAVTVTSPRLTSFHVRRALYRPLSTMATATKIQLSPPKDSGIYSAGVREDAAHTASEVLQEDMEKHHVFFNERGFHST